MRFDFRRGSHSRRLQLHHRFHSPARARLPPAQPLESHAHLAPESPLEHLPSAHQHDDPHGLRTRHLCTTRRNRAIHLRLLPSVDRRPRHHLQHRSPPRPHRSARPRHPRKFLHERSAKQRRRPQHNLLQSIQLRLHHRRSRLHSRHHRQRPGSFAGRERTRHFRRPDPRRRHPIPK